MVQKRMLKSSFGGQSVLRIEGQALLKEVPKKHQLFVLCDDRGFRFEEVKQISSGGDANVGHLHGYCECLGIYLSFQEVVVAIEVFLPKQSLFEHLNAELSLSLLHEQQHLVVIATRKQELSGEQLVKGTAYAPRVDAVVDVAPKHYLWGSIVASHEVFHNAGLIDWEGCSEVTELYLFTIPCQQKIVRLDVRMH